GAPSSALDVASNHAIVGLTHAAASEAISYGVSINAVGAGYIDTRMFARVQKYPGNQAAGAGRVPYGRGGHSEDVTDAVMFLVGTEARRLTGQTLFLGGS